MQLSAIRTRSRIHDWSPTMQPADRGACEDDRARGDHDPSPIRRRRQWIALGRRRRAERRLLADDGVPRARARHRSMARFNRPTDEDGAVAMACACSRTPSSASNRRSARRRRPSRDPLPPTTIGDGSVISTGAIVFAGSSIGAGCIVGDQSCIRERVLMADNCILGRGSLIENDTTVGAGTRIQAEAYITAYSTLEEDVFIAPCVVTTNDNFMGRTEKRKSLMKGPTIRRGARVGGGAIPPPRDRDRRGGVRRRGRGRDEGRTAAEARRRLAGNGACAMWPTTNCALTAAEARACYCPGRAPARRAWPRGSTPRSRAPRRTAAPGRRPGVPE